LGMCESWLSMMMASVHGKHEIQPAYAWGLRE
jgi:hypothetical protein